jgi:hypothetical protein
MWETNLKFQKIIKNKWKNINYHHTWQAFFREWGGTSPFFPQKTGTWYLLGGVGRV